MTKAGPVPATTTFRRNSRRRIAVLSGLAISRLLAPREAVKAEAGHVFLAITLRVVKRAADVLEHRLVECHRDETLAALRVDDDGGQHGDRITILQGPDHVLADLLLGGLDRRDELSNLRRIGLLERHLLAVRRIDGRGLLGV